MNSLLIYFETFTNGYTSYALVIFDILSIAMAILVITSKNPVVSVLFLIGLFLAIALHLLVSGINFIGLCYLLVYVGAVSILFLFILMLINVRVSELLNDTSNTIPLALIIAFSFIYPVNDALPNDISPNDLLTGIKTHNLYFTTFTAYDVLYDAYYVSSKV